MSDSYTNLLYHIVFSTKERRPLITPEYEERLYEYVGGTIRKLGGVSLELNGTEDHVHLLAKLRPDYALSNVLRDLKANATGWMHDVFPSLKNFSWQRGYGAFTVSQSNVEAAADTLRDRRNIIVRFLFETSLFNSFARMGSNTTNVSSNQSAAARSRGLISHSVPYPGLTPRALCFRALRALTAHCLLLTAHCYSKSDLEID